MLQMAKGYRRAIARIILAAWCTVGVAFAFAFAIGDSPVVPSSKARALGLSVLPQGWGFFTRNPREAWLWVYEVDGDGWRAVPQRYSSLRTLAGLRRGGQLFGPEVLDLENRIPMRSRTKIKVKLGSALGNEDLGADELHSIQMANRAVQPTICGEFLFVWRSLTPWAWVNRGLDPPVEGQAARVNVDCSTKEVGVLSGRVE